MRKNKLAITAVCIGLAASMALTGCSGETAEASTATSTPDAAAEATAAEETAGMIRSIDTAAKTITVSVMGEGGGAPDGQPTGGDQQTQPEQPSGDGAAPGSDGQTPPEKPSGDGAAQGSDGQTPPDKPSGDGAAQGADGQTPPDKPTGDGAAQGTDGQTPPEKPSGDSAASGADGQAPSGEMPSTDNDKTYQVTDSTVITDQSGSSITLADLSEGTMVTISADADGNALTVTVGSAGGMGQPGGGQSAAPTSYSAVNAYTENTTLDGETITSEGTDESAVFVSEGADVTISNATVTRTAADSIGGDSSSVYGVGAAMLVTDGTLTVSDSTISTDAAGGAGVFAYGSGTAEVSNTTITTQRGTSGGIHVAGGGTMEASNLTVETSGESSAAIRSDRGGGTMTVDGGSYTTNGTGSPAVYSTADITVSDATLTANNSEGVCIEGLNSLTLNNCDLTSNMPDNSQNDCKWAVILYQSMSGDSEVGNSTFTMKDGSLTVKSGGLFYTTNTESTFTLENVAITPSDTNDFFLKCTGNSNARGWGSTGANGAQCTFTAINQQLPGDIIWDSISTLDLSLTKGSTLTGAIVDDESSAGNGGDGACNVTIDSSSTWVVTGDSTLTVLTNNGTITDDSGNSVTIVDTNGTVLEQGTGSYTVTVSEYIR